MVRRVAGMICPRCHCFCFRMNDGTLNIHRTDFYALGTNRKERCVYSGGTLADAEASITPLRRRTIDRERSNG